jgi:excisionase family DNA binding protein
LNAGKDIAMSKKKQNNIEHAMDSAKDWMNVTDAVNYLGVSRQTLYNLMDRGFLAYYELKGVRGRRTMRKDLDALLQKGKPATPSKERSSS